MCAVMYIDASSNTVVVIIVITVVATIVIVILIISVVLVTRRCIKNKEEYSTGYVCCDRVSSFLLSV